MPAITTADARNWTDGRMVTPEFTAPHYPRVPDPTLPEGEARSHHFTVEVGVTGDAPGDHGSVVNTTEVRLLIDDTEGRNRDTLPDDFPEFEGQDPSVEQFAYTVCDRACGGPADENPNGTAVRIRGNDCTWASPRVTK